MELRITMKKFVQLISIFLLMASNAWAQKAFVVKEIEVRGLERTSEATVKNYLPIKRGQVLRAKQSSEIVKSLYATGFFEDVSVSASGHTLIIDVKERPTIGDLSISGNSVVPTDKLTEVMRSFDISPGRPYNPATIERISQGLLSQYYQLGRYNAKVNVNVRPMPRNRVSIHIDIQEGLIAKIKKINILGNKAFSERTLINQLTVTTTGLFTIITQTDRYSEMHLEESVEKLRNFYLDHGYLRVEIKSAQAEVTPDRKAVYITIVVNEGEPFRIKDYQIKGNLIFPEYSNYITFKRGDYFSRQKVVASQKGINKFLGEKGYMFSNINLQPDIDDTNKEVSLLFNVESGKRTYVRNVTFTENTRTNDKVLRREVQQMESAPASTTKLEESKHRLSLLPFIKEVEMSLNPVPDIDDQVDINYKVKEDSAAQATFKIGFSQAQGFIIGAGVNQKNFLGTGNTLGLNLNRSKLDQFYGIDYTDPYYTEDGISRTISASISRVDPGEVENLNNGYVMNQYNLGMFFSIPIGQELHAYNRIILGGAYQNYLINLLNGKNPGKVSNQIQSFVNEHGRRFQELDLRVGYSRDSRDKAIFPTTGSFNTLSLDVYAPLDRQSLAFYILNYSGKFYQPINDQFILLTKGDFGYGNSFSGARNFPFFKNFYAGGINSVKGYEDYTLGPRDSNGQAYGGNILVDASLSLIFPNYISDSLRTSIFADAGNVYSSLNNRNFGCSPSGKTCSTNSGPLRYSVGLEADWITPFGPVAISVARPFQRKHDDIRIFQFALGANF